MPIAGFSKVENWEKFNSSLLIEVTRANGVFTCTGVAVSDQIVVTAAHCLEGSIQKVKIFLGKNYNKMLPTLEISNFKLHPDYKPRFSNYKNDIAKIKMKEKLPKFINLCPIYQGTNIIGTIYRFGFGARNKKNARTIITPTFKNLNLADSVIELNDTFSESGDSGGPIFIEKENSISILAIHSTLSSGPAGKFSYNPLLNQYLTWIYQN